MELATAKRLVRAAKRLDLDTDNNGKKAVSVYKNYGGRGMYGKTTTGLVVKNFSILVALAAAARFPKKNFKEEKTRFIDEMSHLTSDSMGRDIIVY